MNNITNRAIHFVKKGNISKFSQKNKHRSSLLDDCTDCLVATDLEHHFVFLTEIVLMPQRRDIDIWSVRKKCNGFSVGISIPSSPLMGTCCDRFARYVMPFGRTFVIALPAVLISHFSSFAAILPTFPSLGRQKQLAVRVWFLNAKSVMRWSRSASTNRQY